MPNRMKQCFAFLFLAALAVSEIRAAEIKGKVTESVGNDAIVAIEGETAPKVGDHAVIYYKPADDKPEVLVGNGQVTVVAAGTATVRIAHVTGKLQKDQLARITPAAAATTPTPSPSPTATARPALTPRSIVGPSFAGDWTMADSKNPFKLHLMQNGRNLTGTYEFKHGQMTGDIKGDAATLTWTQQDDQRGGTTTLRLSPDGQSLSGRWDEDPTIFHSGSSRSGMWTFHRGGAVPATATPTPTASPSATPTATATASPTQSAAPQRAGATAAPSTMPSKASASAAAAGVAQPSSSATPTPSPK
jgi:hypothetical protein